MRYIKDWYSWLGLLILPILVIVALSLGRYEIPFMDVVKVLWAKIWHLDSNWSPIYETVIMQVRMPRVIMAILVGAGLSIVGASLQGMFGNPLVSPDILGVSAGAGFGASLGIILVGTGMFAQGLALIFGLVAIAFIYILAGRGTQPIYVLVLSGVIVSSFFQALISVVKFLADPEDKLPAITYWLMGSLSHISYRDISISAPLLILGMVVLWLLRWRINLFTLSEDEVKSMGISVNLLRSLIIVSSTLIIAASVAVAGVISWVGLVIPHMARMLVGANHQRVLPMSLLLGASYLLVIDIFARNLSAVEIPLSILTALIGTPIFALLLKRSQGRIA